MEVREFTQRVERAFVLRSAGLVRWPDPHPGPERAVAEEEYSRVTDPAKWRIIGARVDAWTDALVGEGLAGFDPAAEVRWNDAPGPVVSRTDVIRPRVANGVQLVVCRTRTGDIDDAGVVLGVRSSSEAIADVITILPDCGCDACDSGSADAIDGVDSYVVPVVSGEFRFLRRRRQSITVLGDGRWQASNVAARRAGRTRDRIDEILADPAGWREVSGPSWLARTPRDVRH